MKKLTAIVYTSHTGFTRRYAGMLARASGIPAYDLSQRRELPAPGSAVLYLGWLCAGRIQGLSQARRRWEVRAVCAVGLAPMPPEGVEGLAAAHRLGSTPLFYLRGGYAPDRVRVMYRLMMQPMLRMTAKSQEPEQRVMHTVLVQGGDFTSEKLLSPVLTWLEFHT